MKIYELLEKLINKKYYEDKEQITKKLDVFYAMSKITEDEYTTLALKVEEAYVEVIVENELEDNEK